MGYFDDIISNKGVVKQEKTETYENLNDGYELITEAAYPESIPYMKTMTRQITLPKGKPIGRGNICFLYTNNFKESLNLMTNKKNFINGNQYYYYYYNPKYKGKIFNKIYNIKDLDARKEMYNKIKLETKIHPYVKLVIEANETRNMYFEMSKYIEVFNSITHNVPPLKRISLYWTFVKNILFNKTTSQYSNRFVLVDINNFKLSKDLKDNLENPLFILYYTMFRNIELLKGINIDFYFFTNNKCLKVNPAQADDKTYQKLKLEMKKLYASIKNAESTLDTITNETKLKKQEALEEAKGKIDETVNKPIKDEIVTSDNLKNKGKTIQDESISKKIADKAEKIKSELDQAVPDEVDVPSDIINRAVETRVENEINDDKELLAEIYDKTIAPIVPTNTASSARDALLKKEQENLKIGNMTFKELKNIQANHIKVPVRDVSSSVRTTNNNVKQLRFVNFEKTYNEKLMPKDITNAFLALNDKSIPMYVRKIEVNDTSDELNYKETYTVYLEDANRQRHTIKVDLPKILENKYLFIGGNKKRIKFQNLLYPVVKTKENIVQINTNYNKMFIERVENKSTSANERLFKMITSSDELLKMFPKGNAIAANNANITTVEYDELSKRFAEFNNGKMKLIFNQNDAKEFAESKNIKIPKNNMFIGIDKQEKPIFIDIDTQKTKDGKTIVMVILDSLPEEYKKQYESIKAPARLMYVRAKVMKQFISVGLLLGFWEGLTSVLAKGKVKYRLENKLPTLTPTEGFIQFADCFLIYEETVANSLILNGFKFMDTSKIPINDMDTKDAYLPYIVKRYGTAIISNALLNTYEFYIDPITKEVLEDLNLPTDIVSLILYAVSLLSDSQYVSEIYQGLARIRSTEIIPAILYEQLAKKYTSYRQSNGKKKFTVPQDCVIKEIMALKTVEDLSTLNPTLEMEMCHGISSKGFRGANVDEAYTIEKRMYDASMTGIIAPSSSPDGSVGVNKTLSMEPSIKSLRGYVELKDNKLDELHDVNLFSAAELSIPMGARYDDPTRLGHALKQSKHVIPVKKSSPVLISNGVEEVARFELSSDFVVNAEEAGEIVDYDEASKIMIAKYKSGKCQAINLGGTIVKNGGGGFFLSNKLITTLKVGDKFKANDVLAYHKDFFTNSKFNNCRMNMGTLTKVGIMSTYNTYQDATMITEKFSEEASTEMVFVKQVSIGKNSNVEYMVKVGQEIKVGDSLIQFDDSYDDESLNALLAGLSGAQQEELMAGSRNDVPSKYSGVIEDIKIYSTVETDELSPSLRKIVTKYYNKIDKKKKFLEKYDPESKTSIVKCGMLVTDTNKKISPNKFGVIKGVKVEEGVMIEFYIKHSEPLEIGSKIA